MNNLLHKRRALITGATKRLGKSITLALASSGADVIIHHRPGQERSAKSLIRQCLKYKIKANNIASDFEDPQETYDLIKKASKRYGRIDILINNASIYEKTEIKTLEAAEITRTLNINTYAPLIISQEFAKQTKKGDIINLLDAKTGRMDPEYGVYNLSKKLLAEITKITAIDLAPGIKVNAVAPGIVLPPIDIPKNRLKKRTETTLLLKRGRPQNIVSAILFLLINDFITGETIHVDGGERLKP